MQCESSREFRKEIYESVKAYLNKPYRLNIKTILCVTYRK